MPHPWCPTAASPPPAQRATHSALEGLRAEVHAYEALAPGGQLPSRGELMRASLAGLDASCAAFRVAPALRPELESIAAACAGDNVIYDAPVQALRARTELLGDVRGGAGQGWVALRVRRATPHLPPPPQALSIAGALDASGKAEERGAVLSLVDSLRTARRPELPVLLVQLFRLLSSIARTPGLPAGTTRELEGIADAVGDHLQEVYDGFVSAGLADSVPLPLLQVQEEAAGPRSTAPACCPPRADPPLPLSSSFPTSTALGWRRRRQRSPRSPRRPSWAASRRAPGAAAA